MADMQREIRGLMITVNNGRVLLPNTSVSEIITAATPLLLAAIGEVVVERSGVLNLGVEGMMAIGAVSGFGAAFVTDSPGLGVAAGILFALLPRRFAWACPECGAVLAESRCRESRDRTALDQDFSDRRVSMPVLPVIGDAHHLARRIVGAGRRAGARRRARGRRRR